LYVAYHDKEWGRPVRDDTRLFELLILEGAQAGLSWITVLRKRESYRRAFDGFDPAKVARFGEAKVRRLLADPGIVRHEGKIRSAIGNARAFLAMQREFGSFAAWLKARSGNHPDTRRRRPRTMAEVPAETALSRELSRELRRRGMRFVGPTIIHAFLQAAGVVDEHVEGCWRAGRTAARGHRGAGG
jgi:DNA-3-methyladenine glycosylase I